MVNPSHIKIRSKIIGILLMDARLYRGRSIQECANIIGVTEDVYESYEYGVSSPSLPELESLAYYLKMPLDHFWEDEIISEKGMNDDEIDYEKLIKLRHKIIGTKIQQARTENGLTLERFAELSGVPARTMESYELGETPLPIPELEVISQILNRPLFEFRDQDTILSKAPDMLQITKQLQEMPSDLLAFVMKPINRPYLELAQRLSEMSVDKLRAVAEGLLEITL